MRDEPAPPTVGDQLRGLAAFNRSSKRPTSRSVSGKRQKLNQTA
jgi:hypothetical protein